MRASALFLIVLPLLAAPADDFRAIVDREVPALFSIYKDLHAHPEISQHEERTSALLAEELRKAGYTVTEHIGKYPDGRAAFGVVAILSNGAGPTVLVRTDMDALPVEEKTVGSAQGIVCASTAAGPAFEGGRIGAGMRAGTGAIDTVHVRDGGLECHVIGGGTARGICGSGLVDAAACGLELGLIGANGRLTNPDKRLAPVEGKSYR